MHTTPNGSCVEGHSCKTTGHSQSCTHSTNSQDPFKAIPDSSSIPQLFQTSVPGRCNSTCQHKCAAYILTNATNVRNKRGSAKPGNCAPCNECACVKHRSQLVTVRRPHKSTIYLASPPQLCKLRGLCHPHAHRLGHVYGVQKVEKLVVGC